MADKSHSGESIFLSLLTVLFIGLKLTGHIAWSWWWVLAPVWIPFAIVVGVLAVVGIVMAWAKVRA